MRRVVLSVAVTSAVLLTGCAVAPPSGPSVMALPSQGKTFDTFRREDAYCRQSAAQDSGAAETAAAAGNRATTAAVAGTAIGAGVGAALGATGGNAGAGAAVGAAAGLLVGGSAAGNSAARGGYQAQRLYDTAYTQCMCAYGNTVQSAPAVYGPSPYAYPYPNPYYGAPYPPGVVIGGYYGRPWHHW